MHVRKVPEYLPTQMMGGAHNDGSWNAGAHLLEYWRTVYKHRIIIAAVTVCALICSLLYAFTATPYYTSTAKIRISSYEPILSATKVEGVLQQKSQEQGYLETQFQELKSFSLGDRVLNNTKLREEILAEKDTGGFSLSALFGSSNNAVRLDELDKVSGYSNPIPLIRSYLNMVDVKPIRRTSLVLIEALSTDPLLSAKIANKHSQEYIQWVRENRKEQQSSGLKFLKSQADELREKVADLERELADYAEANSIVAVNKDENITAQRMAQLNQLLTVATAKRIETEKLYREAKDGLLTGAAAFDDASLQQMRSDLGKLESEYKQMGAKFLPTYPKMKQLKAQISSLKGSIADQRKQVLSGLKAKSLAAAEEEKNLEEGLEQQKSKAFELSKKQVQYNVLSRDLVSSRELLSNVLRQIKETSLSVESNSSNVSIVDKAVTPTSPTKPRKRLIVFLGLFLGLGLGLGLAFILNYMDDSLHTPDEVTATLSIPTLGVVPSFELDAPKEAAPDERLANSVQKTEVKEIDEDLLPAVGNFDGLPIVYVHNPKSLASEAYRTIRTGILLSQAGEPPRTILVSSAQSSEGKTTSSINLAASLASAGARVIVVDADLRRPSVYKHFNIDPSLPGLVEVVTGQLSLDEVMVTGIVKRITVIPSGRVPPNPAELLGSLEMATIIDELAGRFDYVIFDSPPVLPVADSVILSRYVDGVVMVVKGGATPRRVVRDAKDRLAGVGARMLGAILNDIDVTSGEYNYYNRYYYTYYQSDGGQGFPHGGKDFGPGGGPQGPMNFS